jgi:hypothetical protein
MVIPAFEVHFKTAKSSGMPVGILCEIFRITILLPPGLKTHKVQLYFCLRSFAMKFYISNNIDYFSEQTAERIFETAHCTWLRIVTSSHSGTGSGSDPKTK